MKFERVKDDGGDARLDELFDVKENRWEKRIIKFGPRVNGDIWISRDESWRYFFFAFVHSEFLESEKWIPTQITFVDSQYIAV